MPDDLKLFIGCLLLAAASIGGYFLGTFLWDRFYGTKNRHDEDD